MRLEELRYVRETEERAMFGRLAPGLINQLTGKELIPQTHADSELLDALALRISPDQIKLLVQIGILKEHEATLFVDRIVKRAKSSKRVNLY
jgi:hypothetical protein